MANFTDNCSYLNITGRLPRSQIVVKQQLVFWHRVCPVKNPRPLCTPSNCQTMSTNPSSALRAELHLSNPQHHPDPVLLSFTNAIASVRERPGLKSVIKRYFRDFFHINQYIITIANADGLTYSY